MDEKKLELRLGPPGDDDDDDVYSSSPLSLGYPSKVSSKRGFYATTVHESRTQAEKQQCPKNALQNSSQTRVTTAPVVGWPPIRSFRKNLASSSSKPTLESDGGSLEKQVKIETSGKGLFVKINMDGIPIGRKVDIKAYDSYHKLSVAVDELFRGLLAAQKSPNEKYLQKEEAITGLLDGSGEYTLVYEDEEGDRMLVGDVPFEMFMFTAKRLRVLKSSELSTIRLGTINRKRTTMEC